MAIDDVRALWSVVVDASVRALAAAGLAAAILLVTRARAAAVQHAVWTAITAAMLAMPLLSRVVPAVTVTPLPAIDLWALAPFAVDETAADAPVPGGDAATSASARASATGASTLTATVRAAGTAARSADAAASAHADARGMSWQARVLMIATLVYVVGLIASAVYVAVGWIVMIALVRRARRVTLADGTVVYESALVAAPVTAGVFRPRVILPAAAWREWAPEMLAAVLAHERTHLRRRDPLVALVARVNRCVFWFHPLAWWLSSKLAAAAEYACDEAAARACSVETYAQALVEIADEVRRHGGRLAWHGIAISGNGRLRARIDRILSERPRPPLTRGGIMGVAGAIAAAIAIAAACRPAAQIVELAPDPIVAQREADWQVRVERDRASRTMTAAQVAELEAVVARDPDDLTAREWLLVYYGDVDRKLDAPAIAARRRHVLWIIAHHPEHAVAGSWGMRLFTTNQDPNPDPEGYAEAKRLWLSQIERADAPVSVFVHAALFFEVADKPLSETCLLKAAAREPGKWSGPLGRLYALTIVGSDASMPFGVLRHVSMTQAHGPFAQRVRRTLDSSSDAELLAAAGEYLIGARQFNTMGKTAGAIDFDVQTLGTTYMQRALALDPQAVRPAAWLHREHAREQNQRLLSALRGLGGDERVRAVAAMPAHDRLHVLPALILGAYFEGEGFRNKKDEAAATAAWGRMKTYAQDALTIGPRMATHPAAGEAMLTAHVHLGTVALWVGDVRTALRHLRAAPDVPPSDAVKYGGGIASSRLARYLLKAGEHEAVAEFYDRMAAINLLERDHLQEAARSIRRGQMPGWYQIAAAREIRR